MECLTKDAEVNTFLKESVVEIKNIYQPLLQYIRTCDIM